MSDHYVVAPHGSREYSPLHNFSGPEFNPGTVIGLVGQLACLLPLRWVLVFGGVILVFGLGLCLGVGLGSPHKPPSHTVCWPSSTGVVDPDCAGGGR